MESKITSLKRYGIDKKVYLKFPQSPGIYIYWQKSTPIYIGKSVNLKSRLLSYLALHLGPKTNQMVNEADSVSFIVVTTELESLLLEAKLIRTYKPKYNVALKDDKNPLYIGITRDYLPRIIPSRKEETKTYKHFYGPFPNSYNVITILKIIRRIFPYADHKIGKRVCFYNHLGLCIPCPNEIKKIEDIDKRKEQEIIYRQNIKNIKKLLDGKFTVLQNDLIRKMKIESDNQNYEMALLTRNQLKILDYITQPRIAPIEFIKNPNLEEDVRSSELNKLKLILNNGIYGNIKILKRIECFDVAHLAGSAATASMVVFVDGGMEKKEYRHFRIRQIKTQSDYDSLKEIAQRRLKNLPEYGGKWTRPDLIVVDGGLGQIKKFYEIFNNINIPIIGIAKNPDRIIFPDGKKVPATKLIQWLRDEAHRFSRRYHHKLISKSLLN